MSWNALPLGAWSLPASASRGVVLLVVFAIGQTRVASPLLPPRVVLDRNRGAAYLTIFVVGAAMFGLFLFLTYYHQTTLGYSPVITGLAFIPAIAMVMIFAQISNIVLPQRIGPRPLAPCWCRVWALACPWRRPSTRGPSAWRPATPALASATLNVGQQLGGSIGTALLNTIATSAAATFVASRIGPAIAASPTAKAALRASAAVNGYTTAFWWTAGIFTVGAIVCGALLRPGPLVPQAPAPASVKLAARSGRP